MDVNISAGIPQQISSIDTLILDLPPSCIEFWRADIQPEYFVIGTYNLEKQEQGTSTEDSSTQVQAPNPQERNGSLILCELGGDKIHILHTLAVPFAILDLHFANRIQRDGKPCHSNWFYTANSTGSIASFRISSLFDGLSTPAKLVIEQQEIHQLWPKDILVLSLCWHPHHADKLSVTLSNGEVHVLSCRDATLKPVGWWQSTTKLALHSLEAWTSAFLGIEGATERGEEMIFSGGDDGILQYTKCPLRYKFLDEEEDSRETQLPTKLPRKFHNAGVTSILPLKSDHILTGSYDDTIRLIRLRPPAVLTQVNLEGGVWRLKLLAIHGENVFDVLASCMHAGTRIIRVILREERESRIEVLAKFEEHESMNYGSDFLPPRKGKEENRDGFTVISTSFYDRRVCLWKFTPEVLEEDKMENEVSYNAF